MFAWVGWAIAKKFIIGNAKWIVIGLLSAVVLFAAFKVYGAFKDRAALLEEKKGTIAALAVDLNMALIEKQSAQETLNRMIAEKIKVEELAKSLIKSHRAIRAEADAQKALFDKERAHNFDQLVQAKPGLIQTRANKATQERFDELETVFND